MITTDTLPSGQTVVFTHRDVINRNRPMRAPYRLPVNLPLIALPLDWTKGQTLTVPILGNDSAGDCMYCAAVHTDQVFTGNVGIEATYDTNTVLQYYRKLSHGDNGLDESQITGEWHTGLCGNPQAAILDSLDIDPTNATLCQSAIALFGHVFFMLSVPSKWIQNAAAGAVWDAPARPNPMNGHGTMWAGVDAKGRYALATWGFWLWLTPAGVSQCDPSAFVVFSKRWFNADGFAPNGLHYDQLAELWQEAGGKALPTGGFPSPLPPSHS